MNKPTLYDFIESHAKKGFTDIKLNLYPRKERQLLNDGFSIQRLGTVKDYPNQHLCKVGWTYAYVEGTVAHRFLELAAAMYPELLQQAEDDAIDPVPLPYSSGGGWEQP